MRLRQKRAIPALSAILACVAKDPAKAAFLYRKAAEQGDAIAACNLGYLYETGVGVTQSWEDAVYWYERSSEKREARAYYHLAWCVEYGKGTELSKERALDLYCLAAEQEYPGAADGVERLRKLLGEL